MALPKIHRLRHRQDFRQVYQQGLRRQGRYLALKALQEDRNAGVTPPTRLGISISQKVSKKAVVRNRIKRQIRAAFYKLLPCVSPGWKIIIIVRPGAQECEYEHFLRELEKLLVKAEVLNGHSRENLL